jgi:hypothetical protein
MAYSLKPLTKLPVGHWSLPCNIVTFGADLSIAAQESARLGRNEKNMGTLKPQVNPNAPGIVRRARRYARKLQRALAIAARKDVRRAPMLAALYTSAQVVGVDPDLRMKKATLSFRGRPIRGSLHQIYEWRILDSLSERELAEVIASSLRETLRRSLRIRSRSS